MNKSNPRGPLSSQAPGPVNKPAMTVVSSAIDPSDEAAQDAQREAESEAIKAKNTARGRDPIQAQLEKDDVAIFNWEAGWFLNPVNGHHFRVSKFYQVNKIAVDTFWTIKTFEDAKDDCIAKKKLLNAHGVKYVVLNPLSRPEDFDAQVLEQAA